MADKWCHLYDVEIVVIDEGDHMLQDGMLNEVGPILKDIKVIFSFFKKVLNRILFLASSNVFL